MSAKSKDKIIKRYPNGAVLVYYRHDFNNTTQAAIGFKTGSRTDGEQFGKTHFLEHMLFHNCRNMPEAELNSLLSKLDCRSNAFTGYNSIYTYFDCPNNTLRKTVKINRDILLNRNFTDVEANKEREVVREEMHRFIDETKESLSYALLKMLEVYPNLQISILGYDETLNKITAQDLINHANKTFVSENLVVAVSSNLPFEEIEKIFLEDIISKFPSNPEEEIDSVMPVCNGILKIPEFNCHQNYFITEPIKDVETVELDFMFRYKGNYLDHQLYASIDSFVFNGLHGMLHNYFRLKNQLCYTAEEYNLDFENLIYKTFVVTTSPKKVNACIDAFTDMMNDIKQNGIPRELFDNYKTYLRNQRARESSVYLPISPSVLFNNQIRYDNAFVGKTLSDMEKITYEEANAYIKKALEDTNVVVNICGNYNPKEIYTQDIVMEKLGASTIVQKAPSMEDILNMNSSDILATISTGNMCDQQRILAAYVASYKRDSEIRNQKTEMSHKTNYKINDNECDDENDFDNGQCDIEMAE